MATLELYPGIKYTQPALPPHEQIEGYWRDKHEQRWRRFEVPRVALPTGGDISLDEMDPELVNQLYDSGHEQVVRFIDSDDARCRNGLWFYNNGKATYITGYHYEYLQWYKLDVGYPFYSDKDRRWYYFTQFCFEDTECMGELYGKKRRDGFSHRCMSVVLATARRTFNAEFGMMSKTGTDGRKLFEKLIYAFRNYPTFYKPQVFSGEDMRKELIFREPAKRATAKNRHITHGVSLNTKIDWANTRESSYDGSKQRILVGDEVGKYPVNVNFEKWLAIASTCLTQGRNIIGKALMGSSVGESEDDGLSKKESMGMAFKAVWNNSDPKEKTTLGRTISGLYRYFTPASDGLEGFIDEFGMSVEEDPKTPVMGIDGKTIKQGAISYLTARRQAKKEAGDIVGYYEECRQFPLKESDMFLDPSNESNSLPVERVYQQIEINQGFATLPLRKGNFVWKDGRRDTIVEFHDDSDGRWLIYWMPNPENRNKIVTKNGRKIPPFSDFGLFSVDPFDHKETTDGKGSDAASHGYRKADAMDPTADRFVTEYLARPMNPYDMYEDMIMQCVFYGWPILGESNKPGCMTYFENRGYYEYLMDRPASTHTEYSKEHQKGKWLPTTGDAVRNSLVNYLRAYIYQNIGYNDQTKKPGFMVFNRTLQDWLTFKGEGQWTDWDLTVSSMLAIAGSLNYKPQRRERPKQPFFQMFSYSDGGSMGAPVYRGEEKKSSEDGSMWNGFPVAPM